MKKMLLICVLSGMAIACYGMEQQEFDLEKGPVDSDQTDQAIFNLADVEPENARHLLSLLDIADNNDQEHQLDIVDDTFIVDILSKMGPEVYKKIYAKIVT